MLHVQLRIHKFEVALSIPYQQMALIRFLLILILAPWLWFGPWKPVDGVFCG